MKARLIPQPRELLATPPVRTFVWRQIDGRRAASSRPASPDLELFYRLCRATLGAGRRLSRYVANVSRLDWSLVRLLALLARPYEPSAAATRKAATLRASTSCRTVPC